MKNTPDDQLSLDFEKGLVAPGEFKNPTLAVQNLRLVYSKVVRDSASPRSDREQTLSEVLSYARSIKW